eukprot:41593-Pyramimonas_sp.AAC.1
MIFDPTTLTKPTDRRVGPGHDDADYPVLQRPSENRGLGWNDARVRIRRPDERKLGAISNEVKVEAPAVLASLFAHVRAAKR